MAHCTVQFVNATVSNPSAPKDPAVRALIRKQAMKQAAETRRRDGSYGKHNLRQYPVFYLNANVEPAPVEEEYLEEANRHTAELMVPQQIWWSRSATSWNTNRKHLLDGLLLPASIAPSPSVQGYELITQKNGFDIVDLSTLATYHVGRATAEALSSDPLQLINLLRFKQWSYLSYLPGLYGRSACLKDAVDCIIARVRQILAPTGDIGHKEVIWHYLRAIDSLQKALNCPRQRLDADVLCATEILALYELLDPSGKEPWIRHANGAARLIQLRGPENYNTEFEKALFMAHSGPIITESLLNNERCFLAHPSWHSVFNSLVLISPNTGPLSDRSPTVIALLILKSRVSALFADITSAICNLSPSNPRLASDDRPSPLEDLRTQAQQLRDDLLAWKRDYDILLETFVVSAAEGSMDFNKRAESTATYLSCRMITNRLLASVSRSERARLERETQFLAAQMLWLEDSVKDVCPHTRLFLVQTVAVARSILATAGEWMGLEGGGREGVMEMETGAVERWRFERWCALFGRKVS